MNSWTIRNNRWTCIISGSPSQTNITGSIYVEMCSYKTISTEFKRDRIGLHYGFIGSINSNTGMDCAAS